jgi:hypothetical protein
LPSCYTVHVQQQAWEFALALPADRPDALPISTRITRYLPGIDTGARMRILSFAYRFLTNFAFLALVYVSLNYIEKYNNRAILAILVLVYAGMRAATSLRSFYFFGRIERLEVESRRLFTLITEGGAQSPLKKQTINDVTLLRRDGEIKAYIDLFFLAAVVLLCVSKIVTD